MAKYKIFVDGSSGTTGLRIADRLAARDEFEILHISEADRKDVNARAAVTKRSITPRHTTFPCVSTVRPTTPRTRTCGI
jgi:N-acetyl-gamma-glutamylphosphate reductase